MYVGLMRGVGGPFDVKPAVRGVYGVFIPVFIVLGITWAVTTVALFVDMICGGYKQSQDLQKPPKVGESDRIPA